MKKYFYTSLLLAFFATGTLVAQKKATIKFDKIEHDYGTIKEDGGKVKCKYTFTNVGDDTLKITGVKPGCGCTTAEWTKTPVMPKKTGFIEVEFDPKQRPGIFNKGITVTTNDPSQQAITLIVKGDVLPKAKTYLDLYPVVIGNLRMESSQFNFGNAKNYEIRSDTLKIYNGWRLPINIGFKDLAAYITAKAIPTELKPGKEGLVIITYDVS